MGISRTTLAANAQSLVLLLLVLGAVSLCSAGSIIVGTDSSENAFPFGGPAAASVNFPSGFPGTEYQEAYASSDFPSGSILITGIDFFLMAGASLLRYVSA
jgi:hypothetical protein